MKSLLVAVAAASLLAFAGSAMAQRYAPPTNPYDGPLHYAPDQGPQMQYMNSHDSTVLDRAPYSGGDMFSDDLSESRTKVTVWPSPQWEPR